MAKKSINSEVLAFKASSRLRRAVAQAAASEERSVSSFLRRVVAAAVSAK